MDGYADCVPFAITRRPATFLRDGAAYAPATDAWRPIADLPPDAAGYSTASHVGDDVFLLSQASGDVALWRYSISRDTSTMAASHSPRASSSARITGHNGHLVLYAGSDEQGRGCPDQVLDPVARNIVPKSRTTRSTRCRSIRQLLSVDGALVLFAKPISAVIDSSEVPPLGCPLDETTGTWVLFPDGDQLTPPMFADGTLAVSPYRGGADGGQVNNWGRLIPNGGMLDLSTQTWRHLPGETTKTQSGGGAVGKAAAFFTGVQGDVLDLVGGEWLEKFLTCPADSVTALRTPSSPRAPICSSSVVVSRARCPTAHFTTGSPLTEAESPSGDQFEGSVDEDIPIRRRLLPAGSKLRRVPQ